METQKFENISLWIILILVGSALTAKKIIMDFKSDFKAKMKKIAEDEKSRSGIHPLITITQAAHESNWGKSGLTEKANNLFGFTGDSWEKAGKPVLKLPTKEFVKGKWVTVDRPFRAYKSWAESVRDWGTLISTQARYKTAYNFAKEGDALNYAVEVAKAGYATDPDYGTKLAALSKTVEAIPTATV